MTDPITDSSPLPFRHRLALIGLVLLVIGFGIITEIRSAFQKDRKTDFGVYARTGWAVRTGLDPYSIKDDRNWHFCYPPPCAIAVVPFADAPTGEPRSFMMPFALSVGLWYVLSVLAVLYAVHALAGAVRPDLAKGSRGWWMARVWPFVLCIGGIGMTLGRGQVNLFVVAAWAVAFSNLINGRSYASGWWLGVATCIKAIPGLIFFVPLLRRDWRAIAGGLVAGFVLCGVVPSIIWGIEGAIEMNAKMIREIISPGATGEKTAERAKELLSAISTDNQSFQAAIQNWMHPDVSTRPSDYELTAKRGHWVISLTLFVMTCLVIVWRPAVNRADQLVEYGLFAIVMLLMSPISHMHYYAFAIPLVTGLWLGHPTRLTKWLLIGWGLVIASSFVPIPVWKELRPFGTCTLATMILWAYGWGVRMGNPKKKPLDKRAAVSVAVVK